MIIALNAVNKNFIKARKIETSLKNTYKNHIFDRCIKEIKMNYINITVFNLIS